MDSGFGRDTFWFHLFYILMSIMTLFSNVISDPSAFECISDVRLMEHTAESINLAAGSHPELGTPEEIHSVTEFVSQLSRLGRAAIKRHANAS
ncbi:uncharacterized protein N7496_010879 [Penicillium cataractarum]|uniref:Uncharacterized protein n=1 Tax=Penicillium cataractarum TaxID=2100454 RepID=A0A9W9UXI4_9EURO|nr:uncharacterized protein N7496_010879 [Penicillium cataractarum]KAJ5358466.1 hypothetical protein N7496_010879 [Penicillium cataractarum]